MEGIEVVARSMGTVAPMTAVSVVHEVTPELVAAFERLLPQLSTSAPSLTADDLTSIVASEAAHLLIGRDESGTIRAAMTLVVFRIPTGVRAWIEDVVVDEAARGRVVGEALNRHALGIARDLGARTVDLTSRPSREAANRLYQRLGFQPRDTNVYRYAGD